MYTVRGAESHRHIFPTIHIHTDEQKALDRHFINYMYTERWTERMEKNDVRLLHVGRLVGYSRLLGWFSKRAGKLQYTSIAPIGRSTTSYRDSHRRTELKLKQPLIP